MQQWCSEHFLNYKSLHYATEVRRQLADICERLEIISNKESSHHNIDQVCILNASTISCCSEINFIAFLSVTTCKIRKCLITGLFNNIAEFQQRDNHYIVLSNRQRAKIHPSSVLSGYHANLNGFSGTNGNGTIGSKMKDGNNQRPMHVLFSEMVQTTQIYLRTVTKIEPEWIEEVLPDFGFANRFNSNQL